ncbi:hypothetical protein Trydic_g2515 [Trypoxylus dichotomus]
MKLVSVEALLIEWILTILIVTKLTASQHSNTNSPINVANLQKLASLSPAALHQTFRYLENPYVAAALVENDRGTKDSLVSGPIPPQFNEPLENADLQNHILRRNGRPITLEEAVNDPILGSYFDSTIEEDSRNVKLNIRT